MANIQFQIQILARDSRQLLLTTEATDDRDAIIHVADALNHTQGSKLRANIISRGNGGVTLPTPQVMRT
jgi:hypothetical protein